MHALTLFVLRKISFDGLFVMACFRLVLITVAAVNVQF